MKILKCVNCEKQQKEGKFCLDCGHALKEVITSEVKFKPIDSNKNPDKLKKDIRTWLNRIGVQNTEIQIDANMQRATVHYKLLGKSYEFTSTLQNNLRNNLAAVEQFLHYRVLGIERGIETTEQAFAGYAQIGYYEDNLRLMSDEELRKELKIQHPDTGTGDRASWEKLMQEKERRKNL